MPKIGEMEPERTSWIDTIYFPGFDAADPANPDPRISLGTLRTAPAVLENKVLGDGTVIGAPLETTAGVGAAAPTIEVAELGDGVRHKTVLELAAFAAGLSGDNADKAIGALIYTFPPGVILVRAAVISIGTQIDDAITTDTPEIGLGTAQASGANATLGAVGATAENIFEGAAVADVAGTVFEGAAQPTGAPAGLLIQSGDPHAVYLNYADGWSNLAAESALAATGTITLVWDLLS